MATYLAKARPRLEKMGELQRRLESGEFSSLQPFGTEMQESLVDARLDTAGCATWETMCFCPKPLGAERTQVLNEYFDEWSFEMLGARGEGWNQLRELPNLWDALSKFDLPGSNVTPMKRPATIER